MTLSLKRYQTETNIGMHHYTCEKIKIMASLLPALVFLFPSSHSLPPQLRESAFDRCAFRKQD